MSRTWAKHIALTMAAAFAKAAHAAARAINEISGAAAPEAEPARRCGSSKGALAVVREHNSATLVTSVRVLEAGTSRRVGGLFIAGGTAAAVSCWRAECSAPHRLDRTVPVSDIAKGAAVLAAHLRDGGQGDARALAAELTLLSMEDRSE